MSLATTITISSRMKDPSDGDRSLKIKFLFVVLLDEWLKKYIDESDSPSIKDSFRNFFRKMYASLKCIMKVLINRYLKNLFV
jgi:hypothetical protein